MIQKLKDLGDGVKTALFYIVGPFVLLAGGAWYVFDLIRKLKEEVKRSEAEAGLKKIEGEIKAVDAVAEKKESDYYELLKKYKAGKGE